MLSWYEAIVAWVSHQIDELAGNLGAIDNACTRSQGNCGREHGEVSDLLDEKALIKTRYVRPGQGQAVEVKAGELLQIQTVNGKQVADFVAFNIHDFGEWVSTATTRSVNTNIVPQLGMSLFSNRRQAMLEIVEDTVGRHDMLYAACDPVRYADLGVPEHASCRMALTDALSSYGVGYDRVPDPVNWFMNVSIQQRGDLEVREPLAEAGDYVVVRALKDVVAAVSACPQDHGPTNAGHPTELRLLVYRDAALPNLSGMDVEPVQASADAESSDGAVVDEVAVVGDAEVVAPDSGVPTDEVVEEVAVAATAGEEPAVAAADSAENFSEAPEVEPAADPKSAESPKSAQVAASASPRPARLRDSAEATVIRVEE